MSGGDIFIRRIHNSTYGAFQISTPDVSFIWKNLIAGNHNGWNELAAYRISRLLHMPCVPSTFVCELGEQAGTAVEFIANAYSPNDAQFDREKRKTIKSFVLNGEFVRQAALMLAFDAILGNKDRHAGNWLVDSKARKMWWIDHGSVRWIGSEKMTLDAFKKLGYTLKSIGVSQKNITQVITAVRNRLENLPEESLAGWQEVQYREWAGVFEDLPEQANHFNRCAARENSWTAFQGIVKGKGIKVPQAEVDRVLAKIARWMPGAAVAE